MKELRINGLEEITSMVGTRTEIYNLIAQHNPTAIIDYRNAYVHIGDERYLIILKKIGKQMKIKLIWRLNGTSGEQFYF